MLNLDLIVVNGEGSQRIQTRDESVQRALESLDEPKREFISLCLNHNPSMRPKAHELLKHHVLQEVIFLPLSSLAFSTSPPFPLSFLLLPPHSFRLTIHPLLHSLTPPSLLPSVYPSLTLSPSVWLSILLFHSFTLSLPPLSFLLSIHHSTLSPSVRLSIPLFQSPLMNYLMISRYLTWSFFVHIHYAIIKKRWSLS